jgi:hypothetical protein
MYLERNGCLYIEEKGKYTNVQITAKNRVVTVSELESITVTPGETVTSLRGAVPMTMDEIKSKFHLDEDHPIKFAKSKKDKDK